MIQEIQEIKSACPDLWSSVYSFFKKTRKTWQWFTLPNPLLGNVTPLEMIRAGRTQRLRIFVETFLEENKLPEQAE